MKTTLRFLVWADRAPPIPVDCRMSRLLHRCRRPPLSLVFHPSKVVQILDYFAVIVTPLVVPFKGIEPRRLAVGPASGTRRSRPEGIALDVPHLAALRGIVIVVLISVLVGFALP